MTTPSPAVVDALSPAEEAVLDRLFDRLRLDRSAPLADGGLDILGRYYDAQRRWRNIGVHVPPGYEALETVIAWPAQAVDAIEERLDVEGFRSETPGLADRCWDIWQANGLDEESQLAHLDALTYARGYVVVGARPGGGLPLVTVESPLWMTHIRNPATREVIAAARFVQPLDPFGVPSQELSSVVQGTLFMPGQTIRISRGDGGWRVVDRNRHGLPFIPVVPLVNRPRTAARSGKSEMNRVIPIAEACCRTVTNLQVAAEFQATPQRWVLGADETDFQDDQGNPVPAWEAYLGKVWALSNENAKAGQFSPADLRNFAEAVRLYGTLAASLTGMPLAYWGVGADNPASADGIVADRERLVKTCERKHRSFGGSWETVMRMALYIELGRRPEGADRIATHWRDPATPTLASRGDYVAKMVTAGVFPPSYGPEALGLPVSEQERIAELREQETPATRLANALNRAAEPAAELSGASDA